MLKDRCKPLAHRVHFVGDLADRSRINGAQRKRAEIGPQHVLSQLCVYARTDVAETKCRVDTMCYSNFRPSNSLANLMNSL